MSSPLRVVLDVTPAVHMHAGIGRYAGRLAQALSEIRDQLELHLFYADPQRRLPDPPLQLLPRRTIATPAKAWRLRVMMATLSRLKLDHVVGKGEVFHATDHLLPPSSMRSVFTVHDLAFLSHGSTHLPLNRWFLRLMMPRFVRAADAVICISEATKRDVRDRYDVPEAKLHVVYLGADGRFQPCCDEASLRDVRARYHLPERFILSVGTIEPRKNHETLLRAYERLVEAGVSSHALVLVGARGWKSARFLDALARSPVRERVVLAGRVPEDDLPLCYAAADLFVYPSWYEGFGLPPLEALACGVPSVVSNVGSLPEVVGDAAMIVDPSDVEALASAMASVIEDDDLRMALRGKGLARARLFDWSTTARQTLDVYRDVLGQRAGRRD